MAGTAAAIIYPVLQLKACRHHSKTTKRLCSIKAMKKLRRILERIAPNLDPAQREHSEAQIDKFGTFAKDDPGEDDEPSVTGLCGGGTFWNWRF
jgi:hypothetical protein